MHCPAAAFTLYGWVCLRAPTRPWYPVRCRSRQEERGGVGGEVYEEGARAQGRAGGGGAGRRRRDRRRDRADRAAPLAVQRLRKRRQANGGPAARATLARSAAPRSPARSGLPAVPRAASALRGPGRAGALGDPVGPRDDSAGARRGTARPEALVGRGRYALRPRLEDRGGDRARGRRHGPEAAALAPPARDRHRQAQPRQGPDVPDARLRSRGGRSVPRSEPRWCFWLARSSWSA